MRSSPTWTKPPRHWRKCSSSWSAATASSRTRSADSESPDQARPYRVRGVDELADLMGTHADTVVPILVRLGQLARAAGIHMMLATHRPAADTTPKKLVSNIPTRIGFMTQ